MFDRTQHVLPVQSATFGREVLDSELPVLVDFSATWCGPCRMLEPTLHALAGEFAGRARVAQVDIDQSPDLAQRYGVTAVPSLLFFQGGQVVDRVVGLLPAPQLRRLLGDLSAAA